MWQWLDRIPVLALVAGAILLGLAPFTPEPHLWEKLKMHGLSETDDAGIRAALAGLYGRFQRLIQTQVERHRGARKREASSLCGPTVSVSFWVSRRKPGRSRSPARPKRSGSSLAKA